MGEARTREGMGDGGEELGLGKGWEMEGGGGRS